jgi:hypothetical protein
MGAIVGAIIGGVSAAIILFVDWLTRSRTANRKTLLKVFWIPTAVGLVLGALVGGTVQETLAGAILGVQICGLSGLISGGVLVVLLVAIERWRKARGNA